MATFKRFEDIMAWQKGREVTNGVYEATNKPGFAKDWGLRDQIRRAAVSIMANNAEGFGRRTDKEFAYFLNISRASCSELQSHLYVSLDQHYISQKDFDEIYQLVEDASKMIYALAKHLTTDIQTYRK